MACAIARRDFGQVGGTVVEIILLRPGLRLAEICSCAADSLISARLVRDALALLLNHCVVYCEAQPVSSRERHVEKRHLTSSTAKANTNGDQHQEAKAMAMKRQNSDAGFPDSIFVYKAAIDVILLRLRNPRYVHLARLMYGEHGEKIARCLLLRGRLTAAKIIKAEYLMHGATGDETATGENTLIMMTKSGFVQWAGSTEKGPTSGGSVRTVGQNILQHEKEYGNDSEGEADRALEESIASRQHDVSDFTPEELDPSKPTYHVASGRIGIAIGTSSRVFGAPIRTNTVDVWMVSTWFLNRVFHSHCCASVVGALMRSRADPVATVALKVYRAGLNVAVRMEMTGTVTDWSNTEPIEFKTIQVELGRTGLVLDDEEFEQAVHVLSDIRPAAVQAVPEHAPSSLIFCTGAMISLARQQTMEDTFVEMHSRTGLRIWRALAMYGCMQEKMIAEKTMLPVKTVREYLYKLHSDGFLSMQEVPKSNEPVRADRPAAIWYLWRADFATAVDRMLQDTIRATRRVLLKSLQLEATPHDNDAQALSKRKVTLKLLQATLCRCDILIILFRDFGPIDQAAFKTLYKTK